MKKMVLIFCASLSIISITSLGFTKTYWTDWTEETTLGTTGLVVGQIIDQNANSIDVTYNGEVVFAQISTGTNYWEPSIPYTGPIVDRAPSSSDIITLRGGSQTVNTIVFSQPVVNPVMAIVSLGAQNTTTSYVFTTPFTILSSGRGYFGDGSFEASTSDIVALTGNEGNGAIQFIGTFSSISWISPEQEPFGWVGFTIGFSDETVGVNTPPNAPTLTSPTNGSTNISLTTEFKTSTFSDSDFEDTHLKTEWQISKVLDFSSTVYSETSQTNLTSMTIPASLLQENTVYYWRVKYYDSSDDGSSWSSTASFQTVSISVTNSSPLPPSLIQPADGSIDVELMPTLKTGSFSDPDSGDTHLKTEWQISNSSDFLTQLLHETSKIHLTFLGVPDLLLLPGTTYYWRVRFYDSNEAVSEWSEAQSFTTGASEVDLDGNGVPDLLENSSVDLDNDGTADSEQTNMKSLNTAVGNGQMGVRFNNSPSIISIDSINSIDPNTVSQVARPETMPLGLFSLRLTLANPGENAEVTVYFSEAAPEGAIWYIYDSIDGWTDYSQYSTFSQDRKSVTMKLKDGGHGDADGVENMIIIDPAGFGIASWIKGLVSDASTNLGVKTAEVSFPDLDLTLNTRLDGNYLSMVLPGTYDMKIIADGYNPKTISNVVISEANIVTQDVTLSCRPKITGSNMEGTPQPNNTLSFDVDTTGCGNNINYRFSYHPDYGTSGYDGTKWTSMTSSEYTSDDSIDFFFDKEGQFIIVAWAVTDSNTVDGSNVPIIGWSVDTSDDVCKTIITGGNTIGNLNVNSPITFTVDAQNACSSSLYYRFSIHPDYGTTGYDGTKWTNMTATEWVQTNSIDYTFTQKGEYIVVVWIATEKENVDPIGIPIIGWSVDID